MDIMIYLCSAFSIVYDCFLLLLHEFIRIEELDYNKKKDLIEGKFYEDRTDKGFLRTIGIVVHGM